MVKISKNSKVAKNQNVIKGKNNKKNGFLKKKSYEETKKELIYDEEENSDTTMDSDTEEHHEESEIEIEEKEDANNLSDDEMDSTSSDDEVVEEKIYHEEVKKVVSNKVSKKTQKSLNHNDVTMKTEQENFGEIESNSPFNLSEDAKSRTVAVYNFKEDKIAFVTFKEQESFKAALKFDCRNHLSNVLYVEQFRHIPVEEKHQTVKHINDFNEEDIKRTIIVSNLNQMQYADKRVFDLFNKCGQIVSVNKVVGKDILVLVTFEKESTLKKALAKDGERLFERNIKVEQYREGMMEFTKLGIIIQNLSKKISVEKLFSLFSKCGDISEDSIKLQNYKTDKKFAEAKIFFKSESEIESALKVQLPVIDAGFQSFLQPLIEVKILENIY